MVSLTYRLYDGGLNASKVEQASARITQEEMRLKGEQEDIEAELRNNYWLVGSSRSKTANLRDAVQNSAKARELYEEQFKGGKRTLLELLDVQQSYYGDEDGSDWNGKPWRYNPVQGGSWKGEPAVILETKEAKDSIYVKTQPRGWANGKAVEDMIMEEWLTLEGGLARLKFRMTYTGKTEHKARHQELPAVFVMPRCDTLVFTDPATGMVTRKQPGFPNERFTVGEPWAAWVDAKDAGLGIWMPHCTEMTTYRVRDSGVGNCSYLAPIQTFALKPGLVFDYEVVLAIGTVEQIRTVFAKLKH
jgi:hypothetical protein